MLILYQLSWLLLDDIIVGYLMQLVIFAPGYWYSAKHLISEAVQ